jgi:hypothetical protein
LTNPATGTVVAMLWMSVILLLSLALAGAVAIYVAYPRRGEEVPHVPWLGDALKRTVESLPTIGNLEGQGGRAHVGEPVAETGRHSR